MSLSIFAEPYAVEPVTSLKVPEQKTVSVIIPCYNEQRFIGKALENLVEQYSAEAYEIIVVDGMSEDRTRDVVAEFQRWHPQLSIRLVENPARNIPRALNLGIAAARGEIIVRIDAHAAPSPGYIRRCVEVLSQKQAEVVGMPCRVQPGADTTMARVIAMAVSHPFGIGDARYRLGDGDAMQEEVDTVAFASFRKSLWSSLGGYDEKLLTNEDYDFNYRVRHRGDRVLLDRSEHCDYFARATLSKLAAQYLRYGVWKARMISRRPRSMKPRHLIAPSFVVSVALLSVLGLWNGLAWNLLALEFAVYFLAAFAFAFQASRKNRAGLGALLLLPFVFLTIHFSWGASFLWGIVSKPR
jgi:succinoglycan biosynthesis protein ExoA